VDEKSSDNQEVISCFALYVQMFIIVIKISVLVHVKLSRDVISSSGNETDADAGNPLGNILLTDGDLAKSMSQKI